MKVCLGHTSARALWRLPASRALGVRRSARVVSTAGATASARSVSRLRQGNLLVASLPRPLHVLVPGAKDVRSSADVVCHTLGVRLPRGSFARLDNASLVAAPELCFVQSAEELDIVPLIYLGFELCARYVLARPDGRLGVPDDPLACDASPRDALVSCDPLCTPESLGNYLARLPAIAGVARARRALAHVMPDAASPMEICVAMLLSLPMRMGGYGFKAPRLNYRVDLRGCSAKVSGAEYRVIDLYWPEYRVGVEYDSTAYHTAEERIAADAQRRAALLTQGIELVTLTRPQVYNAKGLYRAACGLAHAMGRRLRVTSGRFEEAHMELRRWLLYDRLREVR